MKKKLTKKESLTKLIEKYEQLKLEGKTKEAKLIKACIDRISKLGD